MSADALDEFGPVDYVVVEFPAGHQNFTGEIAEELANLVEAGYFSAGMRANYAVMVEIGSFGDEMIKHEYVHFLVHNRDRTIYPMWFDEGFAELLSTMSVKGVAFEYGKPVALIHTLVPLPTSAEFSDDFDLNMSKWVAPAGWTPKTGRLAIAGSTQLGIAKSQVQLGRLNEAKAQLGRLPDADKTHPEAIFWTAKTEQALGNMEQARRFVDVLHGMGCRFALDDFGTDLGGFANLKQLPMDYLKIDGSFMRDLGRDTVSQAMTSAVAAATRKVKGDSGMR